MPETQTKHSAMKEDMVAETNRPTFSTTPSTMSEHGDHSTLPSTESKSKSKLLVVGVVVLIVLVLIGFVFWQKKIKKAMTTPTGQTTKTVVPTPTPVSSIISQRSSGLLTDAVTAKAIVPKTGLPVAVMTTFPANTPAIYLVATLNNAPTGTKIGYVRYLNDKYLDNGLIQTSQVNKKTVSFIWKQKAGTRRPVGSYKVSLFVNGTSVKDVTYTVQ